MLVEVSRPRLAVAMAAESGMFTTNWALLRITVVNRVGFGIEPGQSKPRIRTTHDYCQLEECRRSSSSKLAVGWVCRAVSNLELTLQLPTNFTLGVLHRVDIDIGFTKQVAGGVSDWEHKGIEGAWRRNVATTRGHGQAKKEAIKAQRHIVTHKPHEATMEMPA